MTSKIDKTIARQQIKIAEGQYYEAHQQLRVIASRYVKQNNWQSAIDILYGGAKLLLEAGQGGSGGDLCLFLVDVCNKGEVGVEDDRIKEKVVALLRAFPHDEPTRKRFWNEVIGWSSKFGEYPNGDPELHHAAGLLYAEDREPYEAEKHLVLGTAESPETLANLEYEWYKEDEPHSAAIYASRAVIPYLLVGNLRSANKSFLIFTSRLSFANKALGTQEVSSTSSDMRVYPSLPLLNFICLLLLAIQRGSPDLFRQLAKHYEVHIKELGLWNDALAQIGDLYFGIKLPRQGNPLFDMMGSMFFGGGSGFAGSPKPGLPRAGQQSKATRKVDSPAPPTMDLD